jgi:hypothetical protein
MDTPRAPVADRLLQAGEELPVRATIIEDAGGMVQIRVGAEGLFHRFWISRAIFDLPKEWGVLVR